MMSNRKRGGVGLMITALAHVIDPTLDLDLLARVAFCDLCAKGHIPENGVHIILGAPVPCDAFDYKNKPTASNDENS